MASEGIHLLLARTLSVDISSISALESEAYGSSSSSSSYKLPADENKRHMVLVAHSVLGCLAFAVFLPTGAVFLRLNIPFINLLKFHAFWQLGIVTMIIAASGLGIWLWDQVKPYPNIWLKPHAVLGLVLLGPIVVQPALGFIHHRIFKKRFDAVKAGDTNASPPRRTLVTHLHLWLGRTIITAGIINGALGFCATWHAFNPLQTEHTSRVSLIIYSAIAGVIWLLYVGVGIWHEHRRWSTAITKNKGADAMEELATMNEAKRLSLETGREILKIVGYAKPVVEEEAAVLAQADVFDKEIKAS